MKILIILLSIVGLLNSANFNLFEKETHNISQGDSKVNAYRLDNVILKVDEIESY